MGVEGTAFLGFLRGCYRAKIVTVEVIVILFILGKMLYLPLAEQYYYHIYGSDILRNTSFDFPNGTFCVSSELVNNNTGSNNSYKVVESQSNHLVTYGQIANTIPAILVTIVLGPLTDKYGRKIGIILPTVGTVLQGVFTTFIIYYNLDPYYFILANFINGAFGGYSCFLASCFAYIADISTPRWRSLRIGILESGMAFGGCAGTLLGGYWLRKVNCSFVPLMCFYVACYVLIFLYAAFAIPESLSRSERKEMQLKNPRGLKSYMQGCGFYLGGLSLLSTWKLYVATAAIFIEGLNVFGAILIDVYFLKAPPFDFNSFQIGVYEGVRNASQGLANLLLLAVLVTLTMGDAWILLLAAVVHFGSNLLLGFASLTWQLYAIAAVKGIEGMIWSGARGLMSKLVKPEQQGSLFSVIAAIEAVITLASGTVWPVVFPLTLQHNMRSGMTYIFMAALGFLLIPLIISLLPLKKEYSGTKTKILDSDGSSDPLLSNRRTSYQSVN